MKDLFLKTNMFILFKNMDEKAYIKKEETLRKMTLFSFFNPK